MRTSKRGLAEIAAHEGIVLSKYKDSVGVWTIGVGHTKNAGPPDPINVPGDLSLQSVMEIFARDIKKFEMRVEKAFTRGLTQSQFDAAVSFDFNTGGIHRATWVRLFNSGSDKSAKHAFMKWSKPSEIIPRRQAECDLFFGGQYSGDGKVNVYNATTKGKVLWSSGRRVILPDLALESETNLKPAGEENLAIQYAGKSKTKTRSAVVAATAIIAIFVALRSKISSLFQQDNR